MRGWKICVGVNTRLFSDTLLGGNDIMGEACSKLKTEGMFLELRLNKAHLMTSVSVVSHGIVLTGSRPLG